MAFPATQIFETFLEALRPSERVAGLVVEQERIRFAEFRRAKGRKGRVLIEEGAVLLPKGTIRDGTLVRADLYREALRQLIRKGSPQRLTAQSVILSVPLAHLIGRTITVPGTVDEAAVEEALRLELERTLPFPVDEAYLDWQELRGISKGVGRSFLVVAVRRKDVDPYLDAAAAVGLRTVAVEPLTLSIARGLEDRHGVAYVALVHSDALLAIGIDAAGNPRVFHHRTLPEIPDGPAVAQQLEERSRALASELATFIRFFRAEVGGGEQELIVDGILDERALSAIREIASTFDITIRFEQERHGLSKAAARGAALRAMLPRREDRLISLMAVGTEAAYEREERAFLLQLGMRTIVFGAAFSVLSLAGALGIMTVIERSVGSRATQSTPLPQANLEELQSVNAAIAQATALVRQPSIPPELPSALLNAEPQGVQINRISAEAGTAGVRLEVATLASTPAALKAMHGLLLDRFAAPGSLAAIPLQVFLSEEGPYSYTFEFTLRSDFPSTFRP